jgi:1-phosphofructokinase family hexose kinase
MLLTVTANPSLDRVLHLPELKIGRVNRTTSVELVAAGKGLNVARTATTLGAAAVATGILSGRNGEAVAEIFRADGCTGDWHWLDHGETRICTMLNQTAGDTTVVNEQGPALSEADWTGFTQHVQRLAQTAQVVAICGSAPLGVRAEAPSELALSLVGTGQRVYFDVGYQYLPPLLANPGGVSVKINRDELALGLSVSLAGDSLGPVVEAARIVLKRGAPLVVVTLGSRGALAVTGQDVWQAVPPPVQLTSTVGSGDAMLAGLISAQISGLALPESLAWGVAAGAANACGSLPGHMRLPDFETLLAGVTINQL